MESEGRTASVEEISQETLKKEDSMAQTQCLCNRQNNELTDTGKIFVGGLPSDITKEEFKAYFEKFGSIEDVVVMSDKETNLPRRFGFVKFESPETANNVLKNRFYEPKNKRVEVKKAVSKERMITRSFGSYYDTYNAMYNGSTLPFYPSYGNFGSYYYRPMINYGYGAYSNLHVPGCEWLSYVYYPYQSPNYQSVYYSHSNTYWYQSHNPNYSHRYRNRTPVVIRKNSHVNVNNGNDHSEDVRKNAKVDSEAEVNDHEESVVKNVFENGEGDGDGDSSCVEPIEALSLYSDGSGDQQMGADEKSSSSFTTDS